MLGQRVGQLGRDRNGAFAALGLGFGEYQTASALAVHTRLHTRCLAESALI